MDKVVSSETETYAFVLCEKCGEFRKVMLKVMFYPDGSQ